jgi:glycosyltransferase involved in cell wall biosynthesis
MGVAFYRDIWQQNEMRPSPRIAITYHYSVAFGGSEQVLEVLARMYPQADFFTLLVDPKFIPEALRGRRITASFLDRVPALRRYYRELLPLYPLAVESLDLSGYDLVISADGAATKGVLTDQSAVHLCYCHSPARSYWDGFAVNLRGMSWVMRAAFGPVSQYMRQWDFAAAQRIDGFAVNSKYVAERVRKYYRRESVVIYPPVKVREATVATGPGDYYFSVGRLVAAKRVDLAIKVCNRLGRRLLVAGTGPEEARLRQMAGPTIEFLGRISDAELRDRYAGCRALLFAADEDFGIVAVEAQACGRPVIAFGHGGSLETVRGVWVDELRGREQSCSQYTGIFFAEQTPETLLEAVQTFERYEQEFDPIEIHRFSRRFDEEVFIRRMYSYVEQQIGQLENPARRHWEVDAAMEPLEI